MPQMLTEDADGLANGRVFVFCVKKLIEPFITGRLNHIAFYPCLIFETTSSKWNLFDSVLQLER